MSSSITQNKRNYFLGLAKKIHFTPKDSIIDDCCDFLESLKDDISGLEGLILSSYPIYYGRSEFLISPESLENEVYDEENKVLLESLVGGYEFTNIRSKDKKE